MFIRDGHPNQYKKLVFAPQKIIKVLTFNYKRRLKYLRYIYGFYKTQ